MRDVEFKSSGSHLFRSIFTNSNGFIADKQTASQHGQSLENTKATHPPQTPQTISCKGGPAEGRSFFSLIWPCKHKRHLVFATEAAAQKKGRAKPPCFQAPLPSIFASGRNCRNASSSMTLLTTACLLEMMEANNASLAKLNRSNCLNHLRLSQQRGRARLK